MFDRAIVDTDRFMDLPMSGKAIYFLLGMEADDEGFVSYKKVIRIHGGNEDDVKILTAKGFLIKFDSGVVVITDWNKNNWLDERRTKPTEYQKERRMISITKEKEYVLSTRLAVAKPEESSIEESRGVQNSISSDVPSQDIKEFINSFKEVNPSYELLFKNTTERGSSERLLRKYGKDKMFSTLKELPSIISQPYAPRITTPYELEKNLGKLLAFIQQNKNKNKSRII